MRAVGRGLGKRAGGALGSAVSVGTRAAHSRPPLLLVLDLDETLVRVACEGVHKNRTLSRSDFKVAVDVGTPPAHMTYGCDVAMRPGLGAFLEWIVERRSAGFLEGPWVFTTAVPDFAKQILQRLDPDGQIFGVRLLTREACSPAKMPGFYLKDLSRVPSTSSDGGTSRAVLVDNNPVSCIINPESGLLVRDWLGTDESDDELVRVRSLLETLMEGGPGEAPTAAGNYAGGLSRLIPGHASFRERLRRLGLRLEEDRPEELSQFRDTLRSLSSEMHDIKREVLGAAP